MADDLRSLIADAKTLGFEFRGQSFRGGHLNFVHESGARFTTGCTPGDVHAWKSARRDMEKISGQSLPRQKSGKYRFKPAATLDMRRTNTEIQDAENMERLVARADLLRSSFRQLASRADPEDIEVARGLLHEFEEIRLALADQYRIIDPIH